MDETTQGPTPAQLAAANLVAVTTYEEIDEAIADGRGPLRSWSQSHQNFPPVTSGFVTAPTVVPPPPPPPPPPATNPIAMPAVAPGFTRLFSEDFPGTALDPTKWTDGSGTTATAYNGVSHGTADGLFSNKHVVVANGVAHFQAYPDPANIVSCYGYTAALAAQVSNWCGAGTHSKPTFGPGAIQSVCMKFTPYKGVAPMAINFGTGEIDWAEFNVIPATNEPITKFYATIMPGPNQVQIPITAPAGVDFSQWGVFQSRLTTTGLTIWHSVDGINFVECGPGFTFTPAQIAAGVTGNQNLCIQIQTGDAMANPGPDPSVTAATPVELQVAWVTVDQAA